MRRLFDHHRTRIKDHISLLALVACCVMPSSSFGQEFSAGSSTVYYDADEINLDKETGNLKAKGNAFVLLGNVFVSADSIIYNKQQKTLLAEGGVRIVRSRERITASRILINEQTNEARMDDVEIYADPKDTEAQVNEEVLGFSRAELAFEIARQERSNEILQELSELRSEYANNQPAVSKKQTEVSRRTAGRYAQLLERLIRTRYQPSDVLRDLPEDARKRIENRREAVRTLATKDPQLAKKIAGFQKIPGYLSMKAHRVFQNSDENMDVEKASLTTCRCAPEDNPAWGLSASRAFVEPNEYITLYGTTLEVAQFPLLYSPWFKMPIKTKRQSGFLLPSFYLSRAGDAASFPYYLTLGEHADSTMTLTYFSKRGPRAEVEMRAALSEESRSTAHGEILRQKSGSIGNNDLQITNRWAWNAQTNLPLARRTAFKFDFEKMSDQRYYSDLTKEPGTTQDLFVPQLIVRRFLSQDLALEHSSEAFSLAVRAQKPEDVFSDSDTHIPARVPRIDFLLFPRAIGETGFAWEGRSSYENVIQTKDTENPSKSLRNGSRDSSNARLNYAFPKNPYINTRVGSELGHIKYRTSGFKGELNYGQFDFAADLPLYANLGVGISKAQIETTYRHNITPFASIRWIPEVKRTENFPDIYSTFYSSDNVARSQLLEFGFNTDFQIIQDEFRASEKTDVQSTQLGVRPSAPANEGTLYSLIRTTPPPTPQEAAQFLFGLTSQGKNSAVFENWAQTELKLFVREMRAAENTSSNRMIAARPISWRRSAKFNVRPIGLSIRSGYNFEAVRTALEQNRNLQPGQTPVSAEPWGDVVGALNLSAQPLLPVSLTLNRVWQPVWRLFKEQNTALDISTPFGLSASFSRATKVSEAIDSLGQKFYPEEQLWGVDSNYQPKPWLKFQVQFLRTLKPQPAASHELEYSSLQKITFLGIQDCVDITLQRFKDRDVIERLATWTLGLNLSFLGQQRQIESLGKVVDRAIKSQLSKGQNSTPQ